MSICFRPHQGIILFNTSIVYLYMIYSMKEVSVPIRGLFYLTMANKTTQKATTVVDVSVPIRGLFYLT